MVVFLRWFFNREQLNAFSINEQLQRVILWLPQSSYATFAIPRQANLNVILAVLSERIRNNNSATRPYRKTFHMVFLRHIGRQTNDITLH